jgi:uncharacterized protein
MRIIDFHAHLDSHWLDRPLPDADAVVAGLDRCGVDAACVFTVMGLYGDCEAANQRLAGQVCSHPDRLIPFVTVDPKCGGAAVAEVERRLDEPAFRGVKLHPWLQAFAPSMVKQTVVDILRAAASRGAPVLFHDGTPPYCTTFQVADVARWVPEATVVAGHAGLADYVHAAGQLARELPNLYLCCCGPKAGDLPYLVECAGSDRVLFGSDFGVASWPLLAERLDVVLEAGLTAEVEEQVLWRNAARLLQLPGV